MSELPTISGGVSDLVSEIMQYLGLTDGTWKGDSAREFMEPRIQSLLIRHGDRIQSLLIRHGDERVVVKP